MVGVLATSRTICFMRISGSSISFASGYSVESAPSVDTNMPIGWAS